ncbi:hypothetical protein D3C80_1774460 [compost metagenome]
MFGNQIGGKRQQQQQHNLRGRIVSAPTAHHAQRFTVGPGHRYTGEQTPDRHLQKLHGGTTDGEHHGAHRHRDGKF